MRYVKKLLGIVLGFACVACGQGSLTGPSAVPEPSAATAEVASTQGRGVRISPDPPACTLYGLQLVAVGPNGSGTYIVRAEPLDQNGQPFTPFACGIPAPTWYQATKADQSNVWEGEIQQGIAPKDVTGEACVDNGLTGLGQHAIYCAPGTFSVPPFHGIE
jgi:hypothetical protein